MKKNIDLIIDGIAPEKVMYDTDNHSLVVLYPAQEEFKKGDILASDDALLIFDEYATYNKEKDMLHSLWNNIRTTYNKNWTSKYFTYATDEQKAQVHELLRKEGKKWNEKKLQIEDLVEEFKRGDVVIHDNTKRVSVFDKLRTDKTGFDALFGLSRFKDVHDYCSWNIRTLRHATPSEIEQFDKNLKSIGKKWNKETLQVEDLDISEIVVDLKTAIDYLDCPRYTYNIDKKDKRLNKFEAQITLQLIREAWNKFDSFEVDYANSEQGKYFPVLDIYGDIKYLSSWDTTHISASCLSFPTKERALQFGNQFIELFKTAMEL